MVVPDDEYDENDIPDKKNSNISDEELLIKKNE